MDNYYSFALMLSKAQNKYIRSLTQQKFRKEFNVFIAEGEKISLEWLRSDASINMIVAEEGWAEANKVLINKHREASFHIVSTDELANISNLQTPNHVLLVIALPKPPASLPVDEWCIVLDNIQDPGNMGTIIRIADWFGIQHIIASPDSVAFYNPKVVQSAMGGHLRVQLHEAEPDVFLSRYKKNILAATLDGQKISEMQKPDAAAIVIGNESKGVSDEVLKMATHRVTIPGKGGAESLNAAVSAGILCAMLMSS